jgi:hypothetical protein
MQPIRQHGIAQDWHLRSGINQKILFSGSLRKRRHRHSKHRHYKKKLFACHIGISYPQLTNH